MIEIAITLVILALLIALAAPSFQTWLLNTQIRNSAESMSAGLQRARSEAVRRNQSVQFTLVSITNPLLLDNTCASSAAGSSWVVSQDDPSGKCAENASDVTAPRIVEKRAAGDGSSSAIVAGFDAAGNTANATVEAAVYLAPPPWRGGRGWRSTPSRAWHRWCRATIPGDRSSPRCFPWFLTLLNGL